VPEGKGSMIILFKRSKMTVRARKKNNFAL